MTNEPASAPPATLLFGRYRVREQSGTGRLATVYHATDERLHRNVLLHIMRKELVGQEPLRQRFLTEINAAAQRSHPTLLEVFDSGEANNRPYMVTEYVQGRSLNTLGVLSVEHALLYTRQVVGAVVACQSQHVPHPPVSSSNVVLVGEGQVKLIESWLMPADNVAFDLAHYRAPEQTEGNPPTPASVVYALGILLYELLTGNRPVSGTDAHTVAQAHLSARIAPISQIRPMLSLPTLEKVLLRATARFPEDRYPDAQAFGEALDSLWRSLSAATQPFQVVARPRPVSARPPFSAPPADDAFADTSNTNDTALSSGNRLHPLGKEERQRKSLIRALVGWFVLLLLLLFVAIGSYALASFAVEQFLAIKLPQISLPSLPSIGCTCQNGWAALQKGRCFLSTSTATKVSICENNLAYPPPLWQPYPVVLSCINWMVQTW